MQPQEIHLQVIQYHNIGDVNMISDMKNQILTIFHDNQDKENITNLINADLGKIPIGMTQFQIENFVLNRKEFSTPLMQYQQAKTELFIRVNGFIDSYYQLREANAKIKLAEGRIEEFKVIEELNQKVKDAKIDLQQIEIDKNTFKLTNIEQQAKEKLREALIFYKVFDKYKYLEDLSQEELNKMEEEGWRIKSAYYNELPERYGLTPKGQIVYPHEIGGLSGLLKVLDNNNGQVMLQLKNNQNIEQIE
jgi:hypothetical protein